MAHSPPFLKAILAEATKIAPGRNKATDGAVRYRKGPPSDHYADGKNPNKPGPVHAVDVTHDPAGGFDSYKYAEIVRQKCDDGRETRVKYIVSYSPTLRTDIIASAPEWQWRPKTTRDHYNHVHISIHSGSQVEDSIAPLFNTPIPEPTPPPSTTIDLGDAVQKFKMNVNTDQNGDVWFDVPDVKEDQVVGLVAVRRGYDDSIALATLEYGRPDGGARVLVKGQPSSNYTIHVSYA